MELLTTPAALSIFIITVALSLYTMYRDRDLYYKWVLHPYSIKNGGRYHTILTSGFLHADMPHLIFNMLTFYFFAFSLERVVGSSKFLIIYLGSMILADITTIIKRKDDPNYHSVGASGAIAGVIFSFILFFPTSSMYIMFLPIPIPAPLFGLIYLAYTYYSSKKSYDLINHEAHLWGSLAGIILTILVEPESLRIFIEDIRHYFS